MGLSFHPGTGMVLMCNFDTGFKIPEMVKTRPVVVLSHRHREVCTVVPLSTAEPKPMEPCHHELSPDSLPKRLASERTWAKCDMVTTVGLWRLDRVIDGRDTSTGKRLYSAKCITDTDLRKIHQCVLHVLRLGDLIWPEN